MSVKRLARKDDAEDDELLALFDTDSEEEEPPRKTRSFGASTIARRRKKESYPESNESDADSDADTGPNEREAADDMPPLSLVDPEDLAELRWLEEAASRLLERDPRLTTQWLSIWRIAPIILVLAVLIVVFSFATTQNPLAYFYLIIAIFSTGSLTIISFLQYYTLAFLFLAYQLAAAFYAMYQFIAQMNDVLTCASEHCNHGKKWIYTTNWVLQGFSVGAFLIACRAILSVLSVHREIRRGIYAGPTRTILNPEPVSQYDQDLPVDYFGEFDDTDSRNTNNNNNNSNSNYNR